MEIIIANNYRAMSKAAFRLVVKQIKQDKNTVLGLPSGSTPIGLYDSLAKARRKKEVSFKQIKAFLLDEYVGLAKNNRRSFHYFLKAKLFSRVDIKKTNIFAPNGQAENLKEECIIYDGLIKRQGSLDLVVLGIGLDGHIGFNEPGSNFNSKTRVIKLTEQTRRSNSKDFNSLREVPRQAITMGLGTIMKAKRIILMASGEAKAKIIKKALSCRMTKSVPASILRKHKNLTVILDRAAAGDLIISG